MKQLSYFYIFFLAALFWGCTEEIIIDRSNLPKGMLVIDSYPAGLHKIETRGIPKNQFEYSMFSKCLFIFDSNNMLIKKDFRDNGDATFLVNRADFPTDGPTQESLKACRIFIVGNMKESDLEKLIENESNLDSLLRLKVLANTNSIHLDKLSNFDGLPMIGSSNTVDLSNTAEAQTIAPIILYTVYAKIVVDIQLKAEQNVPGEIPTFELIDWTVHNIPTYTTFNEVAEGTETQFIQDGSKEFVSHTPESKLTEGSNIIVNGGQHMVFDFYTLEHRINPTGKFEYPKGIYDNEKQRYKPLWVGEKQTPIYITIKGRYSDHQGHKKNVIYTLYLGENSIDNFYVNRNTQLTNYVTIKGITNSNGDGTNISVDHRVDIETSNEDFIVKVERETMIDSHIETRPLDVEIHKDGYVDIDIVNPTTKEPISTPSEYNWMRFEKVSDATVGDNYCTNQERFKGKRKYFTDDLLTNEKTGLNKQEHIHTRIDSKDTDKRIWIYFDENPNASVDGMREAMIRFKYFNREGAAKKIEYFKFRQHDLYPIEVTSPDGKTRKYYMEYYEEYLYNFDPKDPYDKRTEGMKWGTTGKLYSENAAIESTSGTLEFFKWISDHIKDAAGKYDYKNNYDGINYTNKLIRGGDNETLQGYLVLPLDQSPRSAAEYCYNKNKRNSEGHILHGEDPQKPNSKIDGIDANDWYLPAIGEIQDITTVAYAKFKVFQEQFYWSSQTSYERGYWEYGNWIFGKYDMTSYGDYFIEDLNKARATMTSMNAGKPEYVRSEVTGHKEYLQIWTELFKPTSNKKTLNEKIISDPGNKHRSEILRVRAVKRAK